MNSKLGSALSCLGVQVLTYTRPTLPLLSANDDPVHTRVVRALKALVSLDSTYLHINCETISR